MAGLAALFASPALPFPSTSTSTSSSCSCRFRPAVACAPRQRHLPAPRRVTRRFDEVEGASRKRRGIGGGGGGGSQASSTRKDKGLAVDFKESRVADFEDLEEDKFLNAVVKVYCTHIRPDYGLPWQKQRQHASTGSAFMIGDGKLLTNAHCVEHDTQVKVKRRGDDKKYVAKDSVTVVGYPLGGDTISVTKGVVSRIEEEKSGYMPPEFIEKGQIWNKFDVFSLGVIIIRIMAGREGYSKSAEMTSQQFTALVHENWRKRRHAKSSYTSQELDSLEVKTCIEIALRCVEVDRVKRPTVTEIINDLKKLDTAKRPLVAQSSGSQEGLVIDPLELRFPVERNMQISSVLQLTNKTDGVIEFIMKMNQVKYRVQPETDVMAPCSKIYIIATLLAQVNAPPNMQCNDMLLVQSRRVSENGLKLENFSQQFYRMTMGMEAVNEKKLPIVYVELPPPLRHLPMPSFLTVLPI